jgi:hypothetical protein
MQKGLRILLTVILAFPFDWRSGAHCQRTPASKDKHSLIKLGFFPFINRGVQVNLATERLFNRAPALTRGFRLDYQKQKQYYKATPTSIKFNPGLEVLSLGYQIKTYPFYFVKHKQYNGFYLGVDLCYYFKIQKIYRYGPAVGGQIGYQRIIKDRFSVGAEIRVTYQQNLNDNVQSLNPKDRYIYNYVYLTFGLKLRQSK